MILSDLAKYSITRSIVQPISDNWAFLSPSFYSVRENGDATLVYNFFRFSTSVIDKLCSEFYNVKIPTRLQCLNSKIRKQQQSETKQVKYIKPTSPKGVENNIFKDQS